LSSSLMMASCSLYKGSKHPIGVESGRIQDGIFGAKELGELCFQLFMNILRTADEAHAAHTIAPEIYVFLSSFNDFGMRGKTEIVIGAKVQNGFSIHFYFSALRRFNDAFGFIEPGCFNSSSSVARRLIRLSFMQQYFLDKRKSKQLSLG